MKKIPLTQGKFTLVDDKNYEWLSQYNWVLQKGRHTYYAKIIDRKCGKKIYMHRLIMGLKSGDKKEVDHINYNGLNNQEYNLRSCTSSQNSQNQRRKNKGLSWDRFTQKWKVRICYLGKELWLGRFKSKVKAKRIYNKKAKELFGEFAYA